MRLTPRGLCTIPVAAGLVTLGVLAGYPVLVVLGAIALGAVIAAVLVAGRHPRVEVTRELFPDRVARGGRAGITLRVRNPGSRRQAGFVAIDRVGTEPVKIAVRSLAAGAEQSYLDRLPTGRRGVHQVGPLVLRRADALGLCRSEIQVGDTATLWVYPRSHPVRVLASGLPLHHHDGETTETSPRGSIDIREVRPYAPGDEVRHLHWKATAKTGQLMIRDYADPFQPRTTVLLDDRQEIPTTAEFEEGIEFAASVVVAAVTADHRAHLVTPSGVDLVTAFGSDAVWQYLDELCRLTRAEHAGIPLVPPALSHTGGGTIVVVSTAASDVDQANLVALRQRYDDMIVVTMDGTAPAVPGARVVGAADALDAIQLWQTGVAS